MPYTYLCTLTSTAIGISQQKGTPSIRIAFRTESDVETGVLVSEIENAPSALYGDLWMSEKTIERTIETLRDVLGWQGTDFEELNAGNPLRGAQAWIVWDYEEYEGKHHPRVQWINAVGGGGGLKKAEPDVAARVAAQFNRLLSRGGAGAQSTLPPSQLQPRTQTPGAPRPSLRTPRAAATPAAQTGGTGSQPVDDLPF